MKTEADLELFYATKLSLNLGEGLVRLKPASLNAAIKRFELPSEFVSLRKWAIDTAAQMAELNPKVWSDIRCEDDLETFAARKVWDRKTERGTFTNSSAAAIAATNNISRFARSQAHEALQHTAKHNKDIATLLPEIKDNMDTYLVREMTKRITQVAIALCNLHPELGQLIHEMQKEAPKALTNDEDNNG